VFQVHVGRARRLGGHRVNGHNFTIRADERDVQIEVNVFHPEHQAARGPGLGVDEQHPPPRRQRRFGAMPQPRPANLVVGRQFHLEHVVADGDRGQRFLLAAGQTPVVQHDPADQQHRHRHQRPEPEADKSAG